MAWIALACRAQQWAHVGQTLLQCTIIILILTCISISILWPNFEPIPLFCGQTPIISPIHLMFSVGLTLFLHAIINYIVILHFWHGNLRGCLGWILHQSKPSYYPFYFTYGSMRLVLTLDKVAHINATNNGGLFFVKEAKVVFLFA